MRSILLNPGPVSLSDGVRQAAVWTDLCHREPEFFNVQASVRKGLVDVYGCDAQEWTSVLLGGSGTTALEAMLSSLLPRAARLLVLENGVYGERISKIADIHGIDFEAVKHDWMEPISFQQVEQLLSSGDFTHCAAVHHETTTGRLNDITRLSKLCDKHGAGLFLDTVSSFGAEAIPFDSKALIACAATANKCLHGIPGLCMVICRQSSIEHAVDPPRSLYLHLPLWSGLQDQDSTPFTPPVNSVLALDQALMEMSKAGGWSARHARYHKLINRVDRALKKYGVELMLEQADYSCVLHSYQIPSGMDYAEIHGGLKQRGFIIYAGQGRLAAEMFRISTMGDISDYDMERLLAALHEVFSGQ
jgi:2-aminoethylphosphonate-pyruvate transaminase